ncbi:HD-GYP domain-containing protein [Clostridium beijerinckii]|uniref:HD-GYP domain-containing protein n=1 Tax=Clostridium beijerinckii TaxID=1520 RepID=UPI001F2ACDED|nr:HD domain-containing protein [Clostridium beijerinckii]
MRLVILNEKAMGKELAVPIYTQSGMIYLNKGAKINERNIEQIKKIGINTVYIDDGINDVTLQEIYDAPLRLKAIKELKNVFDECKRKRYVPEQPVIKIVEEIIENINISENAYLYNNLAKNDKDLELCTHSLNVALLSIIIGYKKKYSEDKILKLGIGAILHDIGKIVSNGEDHTIEGYKLVKSNNYFSATLCTCIRSHHENEDGSGYPQKLKGDKIYEFAKIVSICNEYINILDSDDSILPHHAIEVLAAMGQQRFSNDIYKDFVGSIYCYPNGLSVKLSNGLEAMVIKQNINMPTRPIVAFKENDNIKYIDLVNNLTIFIEEVVY